MSDTTKKNKMPIGIFDSGVGGLSVLIELQSLLPHEDFVFLADQLYVPYGEKSKKELATLTSKITDYFIKQHNIKMMVVACNTATCGAIGELRKKYSFPIVGTVPAIKTAAKRTKTGTVAIISTPSTSQSEILKTLIKNYCRNIKVLNIGCKNLENLVEEGEFNSTAVDDLLFKYLEKVKNSKADCLVLGCTHYPFLKYNIRKFIGRPIELIDGGKAIARQTNNLLMNNFLENNQKHKGKTTYFTTGSPAKFSKVASKLLKTKVQTNNIKI